MLFSCRLLCPGLGGSFDSVLIFTDLEGLLVQKLHRVFLFLPTLVSYFLNYRKYIFHVVQILMLHTNAAFELLQCKAVVATTASEVGVTGVKDAAGVAVRPTVSVKLDLVDTADATEAVEPPGREGCRDCVRGISSLHHGSC